LPGQLLLLHCIYIAKTGKHEKSCECLYFLKTIIRQLRKWEIPFTPLKRKFRKKNRVFGKIIEKMKKNEK